MIECTVQVEYTPGEPVACDREAVIPGYCHCHAYLAADED